MNCSDGSVCMKCRRTFRADAYLIEECMRFLNDNEKQLVIHRYNKFREELTLEKDDSFNEKDDKK